jgi:MFS family permease
MQPSMTSTPGPASERRSAALPATYKWWVIVMLWFVCFFNYADRQSISAVFPELEREFGFNKEQLGLIGSAFMWVYAGGALFAGLVVDRFQRKHLILGGCLFWSFVTLTTSWCSKLWHFVTVRALEGLGETFYFPASMSLASDYHGPQTRSRALSFHQSSVYAGTILGSWLGAWLAMRFGWRVGFYFFGSAGILLALVLYNFLREPRRGEAESPGSPRREEGDAATTHAPPPPHVGSCESPLSIQETFRVIFRSPAVILLMLAFVCANAVATVFLVWTPSFLKDKFHYDLATAGLSGTVFIHSASLLAVPVAGWLADRWSRRFAGGRILVQAAGLLGGATFVFLVGNTRSQTTLIVAMTIFGLCKGFYDSGIFASLYDRIEPRARGTAAGIMNTVGWGGGAFGPWLVGRIAERGSKPTKVENMSDAIAWGGGLYLLGAALLAGAVFCANRDAKVSPPAGTQPAS